MLNDTSNGEPKNKNYSEGIVNETNSDEEDKSPSSSQPKQLEVLVDEPKTARLLAFVQILTASFASFAHGSNDVRFVSSLIKLSLHHTAPSFCCTRAQVVTSLQTSC